MIRFVLIFFSVSAIIGWPSIAQAQEGGMQDVKMAYPTEAGDSLNHKHIESIDTFIDSEITQPITQKKKPTPQRKRLEKFHQLTPNADTKDNFNEENKVKDNKKDLSFNIFYYLIYKYKQVDVFGD